MVTKSLDEFPSLIRRKYTSCANCGDTIKYAFILGDKELCYRCHCQSFEMVV